MSNDLYISVAPAEISTDHGSSIYVEGPDCKGGNIVEYGDSKIGLTPDQAEWLGEQLIKRAKAARMQVRGVA